MTKLDASGLEEAMTWTEAIVDQSMLPQARQMQLQNIIRFGTIAVRVPMCCDNANCRNLKITGFDMDVR